MDSKLKVGTILSIIGLGFGVGTFLYGEMKPSEPNQHLFRELLQDGKVKEFNEKRIAWNEPLSFPNVDLSGMNLAGNKFTISHIC